MMSRKLWGRAAAVAVSLGGSGCHTFVLHEEPITPEPAPVTRVDVAGADTTYVLRASGYALLSRDRRLIWTHTTLDDAVRRYRWLLDAAPPPVAVRVDSAPDAREATSWDGMPLL